MNRGQNGDPNLLDLSPESAEGQHGEEVIPLVAATVVAFIGRTERGPLNEPVAIRSFEDYRRVFGGHSGFQFRVVRRAALLPAWR